MTSRPSRALVALLLPALLALTSCGEDAPDPDAVGSTSQTPHGFVEGASEESEAQLGLVGVEESGAVRILDLLSGETVEVADVGEVRHLSSDGRFVALSTDDGVAVVDSGRWTVDHGDHVHYYRAQPRLAATLDVEGPADISSTGTTTVVHAHGSGEVVVLDRSALGTGEERRLGAFPTQAAAVHPIADALVVADARGVGVVGHDGAAMGDPTSCTDPADGITTRVGVAVTCREGAVLVTDPSEPAETIPYPNDEADTAPARALDGRAGRPIVAAVGGDMGLWLLDTRERSWTKVETRTPLVHAIAVDDAQEHVVAVTEAGHVVVLDPSGRELGRTERVLDPSAATGPTVQVDDARAYVPLPGADVVLEIDYADGARVARSLDLPGDFVAEVG